MLISVQTSPPSGGLTRPFPKRKNYFVVKGARSSSAPNSFLWTKSVCSQQRKKFCANLAEKKFRAKKIPLVTFREYSVSKIYGTKKKDPSLESVLKILVTKVLAHSKQHFLFRCHNTLNLQTNTKKAPILQRSGLVCFEDPLFS